MDVVRGATLGWVGGETAGALLRPGDDFPVTSNSNPGSNVRWSLWPRAARAAGAVADVDAVGHPVGHRVVSPASIGREPVMAKNMTQGSVVLLIQLWMVPRWIITSPS